MYKTGPSGEAPELHQNPPRPQQFINRMNAQVISQTVKEPVVVQQAVTRMISFAELNGGLCTMADLKAARDSVDREPLAVKTRRVCEELFRLVLDGQVTVDASVPIKFNELWIA